MGRVAMGTLVGLIMAAVLGLATAESEPNAFAPVLNMTDTDGKNAAMYKGFIVTNEKVVALVPELSATDKDEIGGARIICGFRIFSKNGYDIPFEAHITSHMEGTAQLRLKSGVNLGKLLRKKYKFQILAFDCGNPTLSSEKAHVVVSVLRMPELPSPAIPGTPTPMSQKIEIVNHKIGSPAPPPADKKDALRMEEPPIPKDAATTDATATSVYPKLKMPDNGGEQFFERKSYIVAMREATLYDTILKLKPAAHKSTKNICGYEVVTRDVPFTVDQLGNVRNTKPLDYSVQKSYIVSVVAKHCDGLVSKPALINIQVSEMCTNGWKDLPTDEEYKAGSKASMPFAKTWFDTCTKDCKNSETVSVTVTLDGDKKINTCEHDTYSMQSQRTNCGASKDSVDLLPQGKPWTAALTRVKGHDTAYKFDGKTAAKVPSSESNHTLGDFFTVATWMQHGQEKKDGHKENVLCNSDGNGMNRHHYALYVHNCRLVFLLRKEASQVDSLDKFQPAEWRWSIPHVCDSKWHHYALSVSYPKAQLYVDGQPIQSDKSVLEVVDDWAIHPSDKVTFQQLTVGACWKGETESFSQYFDGSLAGLSLLSGTTETERTVKCLNSCGEKLQFHAMDQLSVGMSVSFNTELTELTITGSDVEDVKQVLHQVGYTNTNGNPKAGYRNLHVNTNATCDGKPLLVSEQTIPILVSEVSDPKITIAGASSKMRTSREFAQGVDLFTEIMILSDPEQHLNGQENRVNKLDYEDVSKLQQDLRKKLLLDRCEVRVEGKMAREHEKLKLPASLLVKYLMDTKEFDEGFDITGGESFANYETVLRETFYINKNVDKTFAGRKFTVKCSDLNGKFVSNEFVVKLGEMESAHPAAQLYADPKYAHLQAQQLSADVKAVSGVQATVVSGSTSGTVIAVVVVCLVFLVGVIVMAVVRIRTVQGRRRGGNPNVPVEDAPEMEWDNSTLMNVTVNPFESDALMVDLKSGDNTVCDSEEEMMSSEDEGEDDSPKDGGLEWDNSSY